MASKKVAANFTHPSRFLLAFVVVLISSNARAGSVPPIRVEIPEGELSFDGARLIELLRIELGTDVDDARTHAPIENERVAVVHVERAHGAGTDRWSVIYRAGPGAKPIEREIDLGDLPWGARPRGLALAISELIRSETSGGPAVPPPSGGGPLPPGTPTATGTVVETLPGFLLSLGGRTFPAMGAWLFDPRLGFTWGSRRFRLRIDAGYLLGTARSPLGTVSIGVPSAALGLALSGSGSSFAFEVGPRFEVGYATLTGVSTNPSVVASSGGGAVIIASLVGAFRVILSNDWRLGLGLEGGYVLRGVEADANGTRVVGLAGPMFGASLQLVGGI